MNEKHSPNGNKLRKEKTHPSLDFRKVSDVMRQTDLS
jgi:hypothetical protein